MTDPAALQKLLTWLSPAFPVGAFAWSAGLETAIAQRRITDSTSLRNWLEGALSHGGIRTDAIFLAHAFAGQGDQPAMRELADLYLALIPSAERTAETLLTGDAFVDSFLRNELLRVLRAVAAANSQADSGAQLRRSHANLVPARSGS